MVQIANPIYDVVFKYLMNDEKVARLLLSAIIGEEIVSLEFRPTEHQLSVGELLTVLRMDFSAKVMDGSGYERLIIIELQKAKLSTDIMRFRRYLGKQYSNHNNVVSSGEGLPGRQALPILSIYFLGQPLEHSQAPVIHVKREYLDAANNEKIRDKEEFIESLTHDSFIIQIHYLKGRRRTELEQLLMLFDQSNTLSNHHFLQINEEDLPERYRPVLRRLQKALSDPQVLDNMEAEDDIIEEIQEYQRELERREKALEEKDMALEEKDKTIEEKDSQLKTAIAMLAKSGLGATAIANALNLEIREVNSILDTLN